MAGAAVPGLAKESLVFTVRPTPALGVARTVPAVADGREFFSLSAAVQAARQARQTAGTNADLTSSCAAASIVSKLRSN